MKNKLSILFFLIWTFGAKCQNYHLYYELINKSENAIACEQWHQAVQYYNQAFKINVTPFLKDYHNALLCYLEMDSITNSITIAQLLMDNGCDLSYFKENCFDKLRKSNYWTMLSEYNIKTSKKNLQLKKEFKRRYELDQRVDDKKRRVYFFDNIKWLKTLMLSDSFVSERSIGPMLSDYKVSFVPLEMLITHWAELDKSDSLNLLPLFNKLVEKGEIHPTSLANAVYDSMQGKFSRIRNFAYLVVGDSVLSPIFSIEEKNSIDSNRLNLGLNKFQDYQKIVKYAAFNQCFIFNSMRYLVLNNLNLITYFKANGYEIVGDKKYILNLNK